MGVTATADVATADVATATTAVGDNSDDASSTCGQFCGVSASAATTATDASTCGHFCGVSASTTTTALNSYNPLRGASASVDQPMPLRSQPCAAAPDCSSASP